MRKTTRRRGLLAAVVVALGIAGLSLAAASPAAACTCGAIAVPSGASASSSGSRALVHWDGRTETIDLALDLTTSTGAVGFLLPTPGRATITTGDPRLFTALDEVTAPVLHREDDWWGRSARSDGGAESTAATATASAVTASTSIAASSRSRLTSWLTARGLAVTEAQRDRIAEYASEGWSISMIALDPSKAVDGDLAPIRVSFKTDSLVFPFELAATQKGTTSVRIAVVDDSRTQLMQASKTTRNINAAQSIVWAGPVAGTSLASLGSYLTVTDVRLDDPAKQVTSDIAIVPAVANDVIIPSGVSYVPIRLLGVPLGWLLVGWGVVGLAIGCGYLVNRFRAR